MKLAIIVPYRDRRDELDIFLPHMVSFLNNKQIEYIIYIVEQFDEKPFNYGKLCNIGVSETIEFADYYCFHDVNVLPLNDDADYSYKEVPTQLIFENENNESVLPYDKYFGGVVVISKEDFISGLNKLFETLSKGNAEEKKLISDTFQKSISRSPYLPEFDLLDWREIFIKYTAKYKEETWWRDEDYPGKPRFQFDKFLNG
jgi:hypothetical protein